MLVSYTARARYLQVRQSSRGHQSPGKVWGVPAYLFSWEWGEDETQPAKLEPPDRGVMYVGRAEASNSANP